MPLFDTYLMVDWSGRNSLTRVKPAKDAIWVGELRQGGESSEMYARGRTAAFEHVRAQLHELVAEGSKVLAGFDFPYGYPAGLASAAGLVGDTPWRAVWDHLGDEIRDDERNVNNRFLVAAELNRRAGGGPGPFWGCPRAAAGPSLTSTMKGLFEFPVATRQTVLHRLRLTERSTRGVQESWKLLGAGSVGSQALLGIPRVRALRDDCALAGVSAVWPFETGFTPTPVPDEGPFVLHAEIWPGITGESSLNQEVATTGAIRDEAQVRLMCRWAADHDAAGTLGQHFDTPAGLDEVQVETVMSDEGWILS